ncbi:MAG: DUF488 family protein [Prevotella sp.]|nr:DUF488 family protein [Prevotella sp.]
MNIKRIYLPAESSDGFRILVDRLWPRGLKKDDARIDLWEKALAPSTELRQWFGHLPERFPEFAARYESELLANDQWPAFVSEVRRRPVVTLLFAAKDEAHNNAVVLSRLLSQL